MRKMINNKRPLSSVIPCWVLAAKKPRNLPRFCFSFLPMFTLLLFAWTNDVWLLKTPLFCISVTLGEFKSSFPTMRYPWCLMTVSHSVNSSCWWSPCSAVRMSTCNIPYFQLLPKWKLRSWSRACGISSILYSYHQDSFEDPNRYMPSHLNLLSSSGPHCWANWVYTGCQSTVRRWHIPDPNLCDPLLTF